jgi:hypothetical protein
MTGGEVQGEGATRPFSGPAGVGQTLHRSDGADTAAVKPVPKFAVGDRVVTRWGRATVLSLYEWTYDGHPFTYHVRHDWVDAPEGFGKPFGENECEPGGPEPLTYEQLEEREAMELVADLL